MSHFLTINSYRNVKNSSSLELIQIPMNRLSNFDQVQSHHDSMSFSLIIIIKKLIYKKLILNITITFIKILNFKNPSKVSFIFEVLLFLIILSFIYSEMI